VGGSSKLPAGKSGGSKSGGTGKGGGKRPVGAAGAESDARRASTPHASGASALAGARKSVAKRATAGTTRPAASATPGSKKPGKAPRKGYGVHRSSGRVETLGTRPPEMGAPVDGARAQQTAESEATARAAIEAALDKKALMPVLIDVSSMASYTDFIAIVSGRSDRQVDAIADGVTAAMKARGRYLLGQEGSGSGRWTLLDFGDVVIHVFYHPVREFYDLESLWVDAPRIPLKIPPEAILTQPDALYGNP
jgi:ribosome-associated protein